VLVDDGEGARESLSQPVVHDPFASVLRGVRGARVGGPLLSPPPSPLPPLPLPLAATIIARHAARDEPAISLMSVNDARPARQPDAMPTIAR
jgi:hypothetical protein